MDDYRSAASAAMQSKRHSAPSVASERSPSKAALLTAGLAAVAITGGWLYLLAAGLLWLLG